MTTHETDTFPVYKIHRLRGGSGGDVDKSTSDNDELWVLAGNAADKNALEEAYQRAGRGKELRHPRTGDLVLAADEHRDLHKHHVSVRFLARPLYPDDTIGTLKTIVLAELGYRETSFEEVYLFYTEAEAASTEAVEILLGDTMTNANANANEHKQRALGHQFGPGNGGLPFLANPFEITSSAKMDTDLEFKARDLLTTLHSQVLLQVGTVYRNTWSLCLAEDVLAFAQRQGPSRSQQREEYWLRIYYPMLLLRDPETILLTREDVIDARVSPAIRDDTKKRLSLLETTQGTVQALYDLVTAVPTMVTAVPVTQRGIRFLQCVQRPRHVFRLPLDVLFQLLTTAESHPLIKYHPANKQPNMYRLWSDAVAEDGRRIPFVSKPTFGKSVRQVGKGSRALLSVLVTTAQRNLLCEWDESAHMRLQWWDEAAVPLSLEEADVYVREAVTPLLETINECLAPYGYRLDDFVSLTDRRVVIQDMTYELRLAWPHRLDWTAWKACLGQLVVSDRWEESETESGTLAWRWKRVSFYQRALSQEAFVQQQLSSRAGGAAVSSSTLVKGLLENFPELTKKEAEMVVRQTVNEWQTVRGARKTVRSLTAPHPGFPLTIQRLVSFANDLVVTVENIDHIGYLDILPRLLEMLVQLTGDESATAVPAVVRSRCAAPVPIKRVAAKEARAAEAALQDRVPEAAALARPAEVEEEDGGVIDEALMNQFLEMNAFLDDDDFLAEEEEEADEDSYASTPESYFQTTLHSVFRQEAEQSGGATKRAVVLKADEEEEEEQEEEQEGSTAAAAAAAAAAAPTSTRRERNVDNMSITNKNAYFMNRIAKRDPKLILKQDRDGFDSYSRICESTARRQPVLLSQEEWDRIRAENPEQWTDQDVLQYGTEPDKQNYYICPKYWDLKHERVVTEEEIREKHLEDKIIPPNQSKVPPGKYIYKFKDTKQYPGFIKGDKHPDGFCLPCCFTKFTTAAKRRQECTQDKDDKGNMQQQAATQPAASSAAVVAVAASTTASDGNYVMGPDKFPLDKNRWGYLPLPLQLFWQDPAAPYQVSAQNTQLRAGVTCLLRRGMPRPFSQSFVACLADAAQQDVAAFKENLIASLDLDRFLRYQNGNLVVVFQDKAPVRTPSKAWKQRHGNSQVYQSYLKRGATATAQTQALYQLCSAFDRFVAYLRDDQVRIDYEYLWDLVCTPHERLFPTGLQLIVLDLPEDDMTNNVSLVCPRHPTQGIWLASPDTPTLMLVRRGDVFEPIYAFRNNNNNTTVQRTFTESDRDLPAVVRRFFVDIVHPLEEKRLCQAKPGMPSDVTRMKTALTAPVLVTKMAVLGYHPVKQFLHYQSKVVGLLFRQDDANKHTGFLPCYPSAPLPFPEVPLGWLEDDDIAPEPLEETWAFLRDVRKRSRGAIPCAPRFLLVEDEMVVGLLTETNQMVPISKPCPVSDVDEVRRKKDNVSFLLEGSYLAADATVTQSQRGEDKHRSDMVKKIRWETRFYQVFRNTVRLLLQDPAHLDLRQHLQKLLARAPDQLYHETFRQVETTLHTLTGRARSIVFTDREDLFKLDDSISTCLVYHTANKCHERRPFCHFDHVCQLLLPRHHLLHPETDNERLYYQRMADELVRYNRIQSFLFRPRTYLSFGEVGYQVQEQELILLEETEEAVKKLFDEYKDLQVAFAHQYRSFQAYDTRPPLGIPAINRPRMDYTPPPLSESGTPRMMETDAQPGADADADAHQTRCPVKSLKITSPRWRDVLPPTFRDHSTPCPWTFVEKVLGQWISTTTTTTSTLATPTLPTSLLQWKQLLAELYQPLLERHAAAIVDIWAQEGKSMATTSLLQEPGVPVPLSNLVAYLLSESFYLTPLDVWVLLVSFRIPSFFISSTTSPLLLTRKSAHPRRVLSTFGRPTGNDQVLLLWLPSSLRKNTPPTFHWVVNEKKEPWVHWNQLGVEEELHTVAAAAAPKDDNDPLAPLSSFLMQWESASRTKKTPPSRAHRKSKTIKATGGSIKKGVNVTQKRR